MSKVLCSCLMAGGERRLCSLREAEEMTILYDKGFHIKTNTQETGIHQRIPIENLCRQASVLIIFTFCCDGIATYFCLLAPYSYAHYLCGILYI